MYTAYDKKGKKAIWFEITGYFIKIDYSLPDP